MFGQPIYTGGVYAPDEDFPWAHCPRPDKTCDEDLLDISVLWISIREFFRARFPEKVAPCDTAFYDEVFGPCLAGKSVMDELAFVNKYPWIKNQTGLPDFLQDFDGMCLDVGLPGGDTKACTIDWRKYACSAYWLANMPVDVRKVTIAKIKAKGLESVPLPPNCEAPMTDPTYGTGPMSTKSAPVPVPTKAEPSGLSTGQKVAIGIGLVTVAVFAGVVGRS